MSSYASPLMRTIQMTIDEALLADVDAHVRDLGGTRSAFIRDALQAALRRERRRALERRHAAGYAAEPQRPDEVEIWQDEQAWGTA